MIKSNFTRNSDFASLVVLLVVLLSGGSGAQEESIQFPSNPLEGRIVFEKKGCISCHAIFGYGGDVAPDLGEIKYYGTLLDLASIMWNHLPQMSQNMQQKQYIRPDFSEEEMYSLLTYIYFLPYLGDVGNATRGKQLLSSKGCLNCHSVGKETAGKALDLANLSKYASPLYMAQSMWNHSPSMQSEMSSIASGRPELTGFDVADIAAYVRSANPLAEREKVYMTPGDPQHGKSVFKQKGCSSCHDYSGSQKSAAPDLEVLNFHKSVLEIAATLWNHGPQMYELMQDKQMSYPVFEGKEMADLIAYLYFLSFSDKAGDPVAGKNIFKTKGCASCHDVTGTRELVGPSLKQPGRFSRISMVQVMWNHAGIMQSRMLEQNLAWPQFKRGEMNDLYSYLNELGK